MASAASPQADLALGLAQDLEGHQDVAFRLYQRAADAGLAEAQLNVAVMYDSGRGVAADPSKAALYYALAASNGVPRGAYDLAQLYQQGIGVPQNPAVARAWFKNAAALGLQAANEWLLTTPVPSENRRRMLGPAPQAPQLLYPAADAQIPATGRVSLVWSAPAESAPTFYMVEISSLDDKPHDIAKQVTDVSAISVPLNGAEPFAWRVVAFCPSEAQYTSSGWLRFTVRGPG